MLERQKILLYLLKQINRPIEKDFLSLLLFLMRKEAELELKQNFYDFILNESLFSFMLSRDIQKLKQEGFLCCIDSSKLSLSSSPNIKLSAGIIQAMNSIISRYAQWNIAELKDYITSQYSFGTKTLLAAKKIFYTIGYEGYLIDNFLDTLLRKGISTILDVRANAFSRKYGFSGSRFKEFCEELNIHYLHLPELGIPSSVRANLHDFSSYQKLFKTYEDTLRRKHSDSLKRICTLIVQQEAPVAIMCLEKDPRRCHRSRLASIVSQQIDFNPVHL
ncbi:MAG: DUF488 domain-containing protein [Candidatus Methanomethyliaceae archaeon]